MSTETTATTTQTTQAAATPTQEAQNPAGDAAAASKATEAAGTTATTPAKAGEPEKPKAEPKPKAERDTAARVALRKAEAELAATRAEAAKAKEELAGLAKLKEARDRAKDDALAYLEAAGLTMEDVVKAGTKGERVDPVARQALEKAAALEKQLAEEKAAAQKRSDEAKQAEAEAKGRSLVVKELEAGGDKYELTRLAGDEGIEAVTQAAAAYHAIHGKFPTLAQAMEATEAAYEARAKTMAGSKKGAALFAKPVEQKTEDKGTGDATTSKTITSDMAAGRGANPAKPPPEVEDKPTHGSRKAARRAAERVEMTRDAQSALKRT